MSADQLVKFALASLAAIATALAPGTWPAVIVALLVQGLTLFAQAQNIPVPAQAGGAPLPLPPESEWTEPGLVAYARSLAKPVAKGKGTRP